MNEVIRQRFWSRMAIDPQTNCWNWTSGLWGGYGSFYFQNKRYKASRFAFMLTYGYFPTVCRHKCDNSLCVNPDHLEDGSYKDNTQDMMKRGRWRNQYVDRTHCHRGHLLSGDNIRMRGNGRVCKACQKIRTRKFKESRSLLSYENA